MNLPAWDNSKEYSELNGSDFKNDISAIKDIIKKISSINFEYKADFAKVELSASAPFISALQVVSEKENEALTLLYNLQTYVYSEISLDANNTEAKRIDSKLNILKAEFQESMKPSEMYLAKTSAENLSRYLKHPLTEKYAFRWEQERSQKDFLLSEQEENLVTALKASGHTSWGDLYDALSGTIKCEIKLKDEVKTVGLAEAHAMTKVPDEATRKAAWLSIQAAWGQHKESAAAILNSLASWRLELGKKRSHTKPMHFLDASLFSSRIKKETLEAMLNAVEQNIEEVRGGARKMATLLGKKQLDPWDLLAPAPVTTSEKYSFDEGFALVKDSFAAFDPKMGEFVQMMLDNKWVEGRVLPNKRNGAFCTGFTKSRTPRVFQTFVGTSSDISTLAHELGHAYHSWVMRDMTLVESDYPMTLAETASIFSENILFQHQIKNAKSADEKLDVAWSLTEGAVGLLLNIPTRYHFEKSFYEKRAEGAVSAEELSELMQNSFEKWYGDTITMPDKLFWAHKLHFSIADVSFYNYPYTFGYLFSLSVFARQGEFGSGFKQKYIDILRDTGRMTAEDLVMKHLGEDITKPEFWLKSIKFVTDSIAALK